MDNDFINRVYRHAKLSARQLGFDREADDLAQDVLVSYLNNPKSKQTVKQACIDAIRARFGCTRSNVSGKSKIKRIPGSRKISNRTHLDFEKVFKNHIQENKDLELFQLYNDFYRVLANTDNLTPREYEVVASMLNGRNIKETGEYLKMNPDTASIHFKNAYVKLNTVFKLKES